MELQKIKQNKTASILAFGVPATVGMLMSAILQEIMLVQRLLWQLILGCPCCIFILPLA